MHVQQGSLDWKAETDAFLGGLLKWARFDLEFSSRVLPPGSVPSLVVAFTGSDVPLLLHRNGELLLALEHMTTQALRLAPDQHDCLSFDAGDFKLQRDRALHRAAQAALDHVRATGLPFHFPPMSSRERRLLHLALAASGHPTVSEGDPPRRHLVLHPKK